MVNERKHGGYRPTFCPQCNAGVAKIPKEKNKYICPKCRKIYQRVEVLEEAE